MFDRTQRNVYGENVRRNGMIAYFAVYILLGSLLIGCGGGSNVLPHISAFKTITPSFGGLVSPGYLTIGTSPDKPPMEFMDATTRLPSGFDVDLITAIALRMGLQTRLVSANLDTLMPALNQQRYDVVISGVTITDERKQEAGFIPYYSVGETLLVQDSNAHMIESLADLCGQSVGVQSGTVEQHDLLIASAACKQAGKKAINNIVLQDQDAVIQLLATNRVVATYQDSSVSNYYLEQNPNRFAMAGLLVNAAIVGIATRKSDTTLLIGVQNAFDQVKKSGTYQGLLEKWGMTAGAINAV